MKTTGHNALLNGRGRWCSRAFTLVEIMVTVALLTIIIIGLVSMFNQVRRAFLSSLAQVDVLESGRAAADLIARDVEQMAPCYTSNGVNFYVNTSPDYASQSGLLIEQMANANDKWTNLIQQLFFLTPAPPSNGVWTGIGYRLQGIDPQQPMDERFSVGTLYRYYVSGLTPTNQTPAFNVTGQIGSSTTGFTATTLTTNYNRIIDGVTHFSIRAFQTNGLLYPLQKIPFVAQVQQGSRYPDWEYRYAFYSNLVPAYVEIELGIIETAALERYRAFGPGTPAANNYLTSHPGVIHLFRQRIPVRCYDPSAPQ